MKHKREPGHKNEIVLVIVLMVPFMLDWTLTNTKSFSYPHEGLVSLFIHFAQFNVKKSGTFNSSFHCAFNQCWKRKLHLQGKRWKVGIARRVIRVINMFYPSKAAYTESWVLPGFVGLSIVPLSHCFRIGNFPKYTCGWRCDEFITSLIFSSSSSEKKLYRWSVQLA